MGKAKYRNYEKLDAEREEILAKIKSETLVMDKEKLSIFLTRIQKLAISNLLKQPHQAIPSSPP